MMIADNILHLPEEISITNVSEWKMTLLEVLEISTEVTIDATKLCRIDTAGIQLLTVFAADIKLAGKTLTWQGHSKELSKVASQLGLDQLLLLEKNTWQPS